jgi:hypothetical protein
MVHHGLFGLVVGVDEIRFRPLVPAGFSRLRLSGFAYRDLTLDITITGAGSDIGSLTIDGRPGDAIPATLTGRHEVAITLS